MSKIDELLAVLPKSEKEQCEYLYEYFKQEYYETNEWPEWYGICNTLIHGNSSQRKAILADLAFRLNTGLIGGKKPIEWIVDALVKEGENK